ncbi:MAG: NTP transferase domain-containing protein [Holosporales bacterium]|jgi:dTDP-glucose pyrophosphorylase|nr:NTP transferase domain-containing protein [Holosporales bacterium]
MSLEFYSHIINKDETILTALRKINEIAAGSKALTLFVYDKDCKVVGSITDGDIRRALVSGASTADNVTRVTYSDFHYISNINDYKKIRLLKSLNIRLIPVLSGDGKIKKIVDLTDVETILPIDAIIMAGGKGSRLKPYTDDTPKPMLDLEGKPIIAHNIDRLIKYGVNNFYISVNHMRDCIKEYLNNNYKHVNIQCIEEDKPLGTIGSARLVEKFNNEDVLIMNADILTSISFDDFFYEYKETKRDLLIATSGAKIDIPYAVLNVCNGTVSSLTEKPTYTYCSSAGIYLTNKEHLNAILKNQRFDATDFICLMLESKKNVGHFPIMGYWIDIGTPQNYAKAKNEIKYVRF